MESINPLFFKLFSQFGSLYLNEHGEQILTYKNSYYDIIFEFVNLKKSKEEIIQLFQKNNANIIWVDNPYTNLNSITNLLNTIKKETDYSIITILPKSEIYYYVSLKQRKYFQENLSDNSQLSIFDLICDNYYINLNAYSSIRYILNSIIIINEWYYYITTSKYELYSNKNDIGSGTIEKVNCIDNRILLIKK